MEIIAELEPTARGAYCGSLGYVGFDGSMDTNILIRTFTAGRGWVQFPVGGGIVADSDPRRSTTRRCTRPRGCCAPWFDVSSGSTRTTRRTNSAFNPLSRNQSRSPSSNRSSSSGVRTSLFVSRQPGGCTPE